jgi:membrane protein required for colicin V production
MIMLIDIFFLGSMITAIIKGLRNGLIIAVFTIVGWILGLIVAMKFSSVVAEYFKGTINVSEKWLSVISFMAVFILVMIVVRIGASLLEKTVELTMMGWLNRLGGVFFYVLLYAFIFSVMIYFAEKVNLLSEETISSSRVYSWIKPLVHITRLSFLH